jgi:hypothetical protein
MSVMSGSLDENLRYEPGEPLHWSELVETKAHGRLRRRKLREFIAGPLPLPQFFLAAQLPGKALAVWLLVHFRTRITRRDEVTLPADLLAKAGIDHPTTKARALLSLEQAGLIRVARSPGRAPRISLIEPDSPPFPAEQEE